MRLLVLGGSVFLSRAVAESAVAAGHQVTAAHRGRSGSTPDGATWVPWDRDHEPPAALLDEPFDAVLDVARQPSRVAGAVAALGAAHWVYVSSISVYADETTPGGTPQSLPVAEPLHRDLDLSIEPEAYGPMKSACEQLVRTGARSSTIVRPGLIVGPGDPSGRFTYWVERLADDGEVLAPGAPSDPVQVIDVRDLAAWLVLLAERRVAGTFDAVGPRTDRGTALAEIARGVGAPGAELTWVSQEFLLDRGVPPWMGPGSLPLWVPLPEYAGHLAHDPSASLAAGLTNRPLAETARDTLAWLRDDPDAVRQGLSREAETGLLRDWHNLAV